MLENQCFYCSNNWNRYIKLVARQSLFIGQFVIFNRGRKLAAAKKEFEIKHNIFHETKGNKEKRDAETKRGYAAEAGIKMQRFSRLRFVAINNYN